MLKNLTLGGDGGVQGQIRGDVRQTCTACAGTLLLELGVLSRLTGNATYEKKARHAVETIFGGCRAGLLRMDGWGAGRLREREPAGKEKKAASRSEA